DFLAELGFGTDFSRYCGELDGKLTKAVNAILATETPSSAVDGLKTYIKSLRKNGDFIEKGLTRARVALLTDLRGRRDEIVPIITEALAKDIDGRLNQILRLLAAKNVFVLTGGALEHYLPSYSGHRYKLEDSTKRATIEAEVLALSQGIYDSQLAERYRDLFENIVKLPA
ncbi:MAG: hypothetical protein HY765_10975, partial [Rhodomicrobium sp.]|nr:hypothetical protein [Rhodomicrobium sp.]